MSRCAVFALVAALILSTSADGDFRVPSRAHYPETWFHFIGGNVSREGIVADLDAIAGAGIRGIHFFDGLSRCGAFPGVTNLLQSLSREWDETVGFLADECRKRNLGLVLQNCPGWSMSGGPWIKPDNTMREIVMGRTFVRAGEKARTERSTKATDAPWRDYRDVAVLAFTSVAGDGENLPPPSSVVTNADGFSWRFVSPVMARTLVLPPVRRMEPEWVYDPRLTFELLADGKSVVRGVFPPSSFHEELPLSVAIGEVSARDWRIVYRGEHAFLPAIAGLVAAARPNNYEAMAGWTLRGELPLLASPFGGRTGEGPDECLDLTDRLRPDGSLDWTPPSGRWTVLRFGHVNMGKRNHPATKEATGWECDKLDPRGIEANFVGYLGRLMRGPLADGKVQGLLVDSWECDTQTWTWRLPEEFMKRRGYDVRKLLPALFGYVIGNQQRTEALLRDWRGFLAELVEENYYRRLAEIGHAHGLHVQYETAFGDIIPGDLLRYWKYADTPMCEFWQPHDEARGGVVSGNYKPVRPCVSAAHVYGKRRVAAEAFTSFDLTFDEDFNLLKRVGDFNYAKGVTHFVFQTYTHNPLVNALPPGVSFGRKVGTPFLRGQPWWPFMKDFCTYCARCETMLERGRPVVDILWYLGDALGHKPDENAPFPFGLKYDYCNQDVLLNRLKVRDGRLILPDGMSYGALWVPSGTLVDRKSEIRIAELERVGARVFRDIPAAALKGLVPQIEAPAGAFNWCHRQEGMTDIYFVSVETNDYCGMVTLHGSAGRKELCLDLHAGESRFVVMDGDKTQVLDPVTGEDELPRTDLCLAEWEPIPGTNAFATTFRWDGKTKGPVVLDLGEVHAWAHVRVNGVGTRDLWCAPYRVDIASLLRSGDNDIVIEVVSTSYNQLVEDAAKPLPERRTSTVCGPTARDPLHPAGLYGPVSVRIADTPRPVSEAAFKGEIALSLKHGVAGGPSAASWYGRILVAPQPGHLKSIRSSTSIPKGMVELDLRFEGGKPESPVVLLAGLEGEFEYLGTSRPLAAGRHLL